MITRSIWLAREPDAAFDLPRNRISEWWPPSHRPSKSGASQLYLEADGRFCEVAPDGCAIDLGRVIEWNRPHRLRLDFYLGTGPAMPTAVTIAFIPQGAGTRAHVEHRPTPESEAAWQQRAPVYEASWKAGLSAFECLASR